MYCRKCGAINSDGADFCSLCHFDFNINKRDVAKPIFNGEVAKENIITLKVILLACGSIVALSVIGFVILLFIFYIYGHR